MQCLSACSRVPLAPRARHWTFKAHLLAPQPFIVAPRQPASTLRRVVAVPRAEGASGGGGGSGSDEDKQFVRSTEFGYSRKDVILIGVGLIGLGYVLYYGLQATGMEAGMAGSWVQLIIFLGICFGWVGSYLFRVSTKQMTYAKQLEAYEEAVMRKRLEELPEEELERLMSESERKQPRGGSGGGSQ